MGDAFQLDAAFGCQMTASFLVIKKWYCWWFRNPAITSWYVTYIYISPLFTTRFYTSQVVVWDFFHQQHQSPHLPVPYLEPQRLPVANLISGNDRPMVKQIYIGNWRMREKSTFTTPCIILIRISVIGFVSYPSNLDPSHWNKRNPHDNPQKGPQKKMATWHRKPDIQKILKL